MSDLKPCEHLNVTVTTARGPYCVDCGALLVSVFSGVERAQPAQPAQPAQAGQVLTDEEIDAAYEKARADYQRSRFAVRGQQLTAQDSPDWWFARAIEQAVLAKRVPTKRGWMCLTDFQHELGEAAGGVTIYSDLEDLKTNRPCWEQCGVIEVGIVGEKGGA